MFSTIFITDEIIVMGVCVIAAGAFSEKTDVAIDALCGHAGSS